jgi:tetratricopeptide (TPR) repeat protein
MHDILRIRGERNWDMASIGRVLVLAVCLIAVTASAQSGPAKGQVKIWEEPLVLPSYRVDPPDPSPMFYTGASYQGAQKRIYPYPLIDRITGIREEGTWKSLNLENEYIRLSVLPEIGGRLFSAVDKTNGYDIFYHQRVIKPALIGMLGAWISGGIEWCVFHHHRNTTYMPVDYTLAENPDGSKTIWFGETERRHRMRWLIGITLYPDKSYIEATVKMFNRTALPNSILYWANVAVHVNDDYQVIFPPSVQIATYHSKNDFAYWPIGKGRYRGTDYSGVDESWWKNHPNAVSFFAWDRQEDFMGGYDHGREAGVASIGDHHVVTGAKLWEWGPNNIWDTKVLTDSDGPYAELMVGAFSDNQPDYSWIKPYEVKTFKQYWYPIRQIGGMKNATLDAAVNLELDPNGMAKLGFNATSRFKRAKVVLAAAGKTLFEQTVDIGPDKPYVKQVKVPEGTQVTALKASLVTSDGRTLVSYQPQEKPQPSKLPDTVKAPPAPKDIEKIEDLYLTGLRLEQICNPSVDPFDYYREALKRDPNDSRTNTIVGVNYNKRGMYEQAEEHLRRAIRRLSADYTRPVNTEAYYHLGLALKGQGRLDEAYDAFYRATWDYAFHSAGYFQLAILSSRKGDFAKALEHIDRSISMNALNTKAVDFRAAVLRKLGRGKEATTTVTGVLAADPLDFLAMNEQYLLQSAMGKKSGAQRLVDRMKAAMRGEAQSYLELAADYMEWGLWDEAIDVLQRPVKFQTSFAGTYPMVYYYLGYLYEQKGQTEKATEQYRLAAKMPTDYCFPFRLESADVLKAAIKANPSDARAYYYLGNLLYDNQPEKAIEAWERSASLDGSLAVVHRNLGWGYYRHDSNTVKAIASYEKAIACTGRDAGYYLELDDLYERANASPEKRLKMFEDNHELIAQRKPLLIREIALLVPMAKYDRAIDLLTNNQFYTSEGGGRELHDTYVDAHLLRGLAYMNEKQHEKALKHFQQASEYPENLAIERPENDRRGPQVAYLTGTAYAAMGQTEQANKSYTQATTQEIRFGGSEARFYQAMALQELGQKEKADGIFKDLVAGGTKRLSGESDVDFFAKFGERQTRQAQRATAHYELGLGLLGQGRLDEAKNQFEQAINFNAAHTWARYHLSSLQSR